MPFSEFRKQLFAMLAANDAQLADACLARIDKLRDRHGHISNEPHHPDILSGRAWPKEATDSTLLTESMIRQSA